MSNASEDSPQTAAGHCENCQLNFKVEDSVQFAKVVNTLHLADREIPGSFISLTIYGCRACSPDGGWKIVEIK